jgi:hypothetical protein
LNQARGALTRATLRRGAKSSQRCEAADSETRSRSKGSTIKEDSRAEIIDGFAEVGLDIVEIELSLPVDLRQALGRGEAEQTLAPADLFHADHEQGQAEEDGADKPAASRRRRTASTANRAEAPSRNRAESHSTAGPPGRNRGIRPGSP